MQQKDSLPTSNTTARVRIVSGFFLVLSLGVFFQLVKWQIWERGNLAKIAAKQQGVSSQVSGKRGAILASDDYPLAYSTQGWLVYAKPQEVDDVQALARTLAGVWARQIPVRQQTDAEETQEYKEESLRELVKKEEERLVGLMTRDAAWVQLKTEVEDEIKRKIEVMGLDAIGFEQAETRKYPEGKLGSHILGFVGKDEGGANKGYFGLEGRFDLSLSPVTGSITWQKDALGNFLSEEGGQVGSADGVTIKTTIERSIQFTIEKHLEEGLKKYGATEASAVVVEPQSGKVLALANLPNYSPENFSLAKQEDFINPVTSKSFEPGSVFKVIVMAAALDSGKVKQNDKCSACEGPRNIAGFSLKTWDEKYHPDATPGEIIKNSDNIGMVWIAEKLGKDRLYEYLDDFGFGKISGIDLQGEVSPQLKNIKDWGLIDLATASFGQGVAVTPIQMVRAVAAIANKGYLASPFVVEKIQTGTWEERIKKLKPKRVVSERTAQAITEMMVEAVKNGEAKWAAPKGFSIAGKTGTAQIPVSGHYDTEKTIASFVGFAPSNNPEFVMLVTLKEPKSSPWASETAAPLWFSMAKDLFPLLGVQPN